ncbi:Peroxisomal biogenesis factor 19 [Pseudolycoriella hygida]|uniref:Peroxin-19 n=1 Tax=Pseudolycoriella hygida TaxID=35572 RepID=A0A9Q0MIY0_9DIPT|nr:Peroxisomal biogenesis factor 19 [Pseudolycoriella hygida]KAJ6625711.1 Peroxisomal biogenesis factor 19 [Pseudolycoriella hygida]
MSADKEKPASKTNDKELDDLLDSALEDFDKNKDSTESVTKANPGEDFFSNEDVMNQARLLEQHMASLFGTAPDDGTINAEQFNAGLQKFAEATSIAMGGDGSVEPQFVDSITQAIQGLKEGTENLNATAPPADLSAMFSGLQMSEDAGDGNPFLPFVQGMMQSLLSAEVLLPSLKELLEKYPVWLAENGDKIDPADKERYVKQQELFKVICADLEQEKPTDSAEVKSDRFKKVLDNMKKLHDYGQPPAELVDAGVEMPQLPPMGDPSSQCPMIPRKFKRCNATRKFIAMSFEPHASDDPSNCNPFLPLVEKIKQRLLSTERLLPVMKVRVERYPVWLAENGNKIDPADKERYVKQLELYKVIYEDLQQEKPTDSAEVKSERAKKVLDNMNKLYDYGRPPDEMAHIVPETPETFPMGDPSSQCPMIYNWKIFFYSNL